MQTFLPYPNFTESAKVLDMRRLGCQRKEAYQIYQAITNPNYGWQNHPCVQMWRAYPGALCAYYTAVCNEWKARGYKHNMPALEVAEYDVPIWLGNDEFHRSHRSNLLRKNYEWYSRFWIEPTDLAYVWPKGE